MPFMGSELVQVKESLASSSLPSSTLRTSKLENNHHYGVRDAVADEVLPVLTGDEGEKSGDEMIIQATDKNGHERRHEIEEMLHPAFFQAGKNADQQNKKCKKTY